MKVAENHQVWLGCFDSLLKLNIHVVVRETGQIYQREKYILNAENDLMQLFLENDVIEIGKQGKLQIQINNSFPYPLNNGYITIDGFGISKSILIKEQLLPKSTTIIPVEFIPLRAGLGRLYVTLATDSLRLTPKFVLLRVTRPSNQNNAIRDMAPKVQPETTVTNFSVATQEQVIDKDKPIDVTQKVKTVTIPDVSQPDSKRDVLDKDKPAEIKILFTTAPIPDDFAQETRHDVIDKEIPIKRETAVTVIPTPDAFTPEKKHDDIDKEKFITTETTFTTVPMQEVFETETKLDVIGKEKPIEIKPTVITIQKPDIADMQTNQYYILKEEPIEIGTTAETVVITDLTQPEFNNDVVEIQKTVETTPAVETVSSLDAGAQNTKTDLIELQESEEDTMEAITLKMPDLETADTKIDVIKTHKPADITTEVRTRPMTDAIAKEVKTDVIEEEKPLKTILEDVTTLVPDMTPPEAQADAIKEQKPDVMTTEAITVLAPDMTAAETKTYVIEEYKPDATTLEPVTLVAPDLIAPETKTHVIEEYKPLEATLEDVTALVPDMTTSQRQITVTEEEKPEITTVEVITELVPDLSTLETDNDVTEEQKLDATMLEAIPVLVPDLTAPETKTHVIEEYTPLETTLEDVTTLVPDMTASQWQTVVTDEQKPDATTLEAITVLAPDLTAPETKTYVIDEYTPLETTLEGVTALAPDMTASQSQITVTEEEKPEITTVEVITELVPDLSTLGTKTDVTEEQKPDATMLEAITALAPDLTAPETKTYVIEEYTPLETTLEGVTTLVPDMTTSQRQTVVIEEQKPDATTLEAITVLAPDLTAPETKTYVIDEYTPLETTLEDVTALVPDMAESQKYITVTEEEKPEITTVEVITELVPDLGTLGTKMDITEEQKPDVTTLEAEPERKHDGVDMEKLLENTTTGALVPTVDVSISETKPAVSIESKPIGETIIAKTLPVTIISVPAAEPEDEGGDNRTQATSKVTPMAIENIFSPEAKSVVLDKEKTFDVARMVGNSPIIDISALEMNDDIPTNIITGPVGFDQRNLDETMIHLQSDLLNAEETSFQPETTTDIPENEAQPHLPTMSLLDNTMLATKATLALEEVKPEEVLEYEQSQLLDAGQTIVEPETMAPAPKKEETFHLQTLPSFDTTMQTIKDSGQSYEPVTDSDLSLASTASDTSQDSKSSSSTTLKIVETDIIDEPHVKYIPTEASQMTATITENEIEVEQNLRTIGSPTQFSDDTASLYSFLDPTIDVSDIDELEEETDDEFFDTYTEITDSSMDHASKTSDLPENTTITSSHTPNIQMTTIDDVNESTTDHIYEIIYSEATIMAARLLSDVIHDINFMSSDQSHLMSISEENSISDDEERNSLTFNSSTLARKDMSTATMDTIKDDELLHSEMITDVDNNLSTRFQDNLTLTAELLACKILTLAMDPTVFESNEPLKINDIIPLIQIPTTKDKDSSANIFVTSKLYEDYIHQHEPMESLISPTSIIYSGDKPDVTRDNIGVANQHSFLLAMSNNYDIEKEPMGYILPEQSMAIKDMFTSNEGNNNRTISTDKIESVSNDMNTDGKELSSTIIYTDVLTNPSYIQPINSANITFQSDDIISENENISTRPLNYNYI
ncbi:unnamed protein product [Rotaria sordida]|uniref:Uncharacterized protein n=2 Tax=Rotaria sordida TaxID=392033 RepID=A0A818KDW6_9BILA|nr:unnamed protein product [Rotaria sordida]